MINVTKPFFPPLVEYTSYLEEVWKRGWITNNGPLVNHLELKLKERLQVDHLLFVTNGTVALQMAIRSLDLKGEVITTPFSYVATTSSIVWENCTPVFVDIDPATLNIDERLIEQAISPKTSAILATHVFGSPCNIDAIQEIATRRGLKVIYDAAHCFGTTYKGKSVYSYGDVSTASFHATKVFHCAEGGAVVTRSEEVIHRIAQLRNFGHAGYVAFDGIGINGKNSELHAALGIVNLKYVDELTARREKQCRHYDGLLKNFRRQAISISSDAVVNHAYYPVIFETEEQLLKTNDVLGENHITPRRYFYPSLNTLPYVERVRMPVSESVAARIFCLPLYYELEETDIDLICRLLMRVQNNQPWKK